MIKGVIYTMQKDKDRKQASEPKTRVKEKRKSLFKEVKICMVAHS